MYTQSFNVPDNTAAPLQAVPAEGEQPETEDETDDAEDRPRPDEDQA